MIYWILCLLVLILPLTGSAEHYNFKNYDIEHGLAQSQVRSLYQDSKGYLWIGTSGGGISRFDGKSFTHFTTRDGLANNDVLVIFEDSGGNIWFGTGEGVSRYDGSAFHPLNPGNSLGNARVRAILEDKTGHLWFGTENGVWTYNRETSGFRHLTVKDGLADDVIMSMLADSKGNLWLGTENRGLSKYDGTGFSNFSIPAGLPDVTINSILEDRNKNLWFASDKGVSKYDGKMFRSYTEEDGLGSNSVKTIIEDREGNLWFGASRGGVCKFDGSVFTCFTKENGLSSNTVWALLEDREGNIWIGTYRGGLDKYSGETFTYYSSKDGLGDDVVRAIRLDREGNFWFGTYRGGVTRFDGKSFTTFTTKDGLIDDFVLTIFQDRKGNLWFGTFNGVSIYDGRHFINLTMEDGLADGVVRSIIEDRAGNIWMGTNKGGISRYDGKTITNFTTTHGLNDDRVETIMEDHEGTIWIGTLNGICHYNGNTKTFSNFSEKWGLKQKNIYSIIEDGKGTLWFAAYGDGIIKYNPTGKRTFEVFSSKDGLINDNVVSLIFDDEGKLWIGTEKGICRFDVEAYERTGQKIFKHYGVEDGFIGIECIDNAVCKDREGNTWFGTVKGAIKYNPHWDKPNLVEPLTHITDLHLISGEKPWFEYAGGISLQDGLPIGLRLPHDKNYLIFDFIGISLTVPGKVNYRCRLVGLDDTWISPGEGSYASYSNLPPGRYTFLVKACNNDGVWNKEPASFRFRILPPFWQTWWFYLLCGVLAAGSIFAFIKIRLRSLEKQQRILEEKVRISTRELQKEKEKVEQINLELEDRVRARTSELVRVNRSLQEEIAERKLVEEALRESEEKFRLVVENANDAIFIVQDDMVKFPNPKAENMFGCSREELAEIPFIDLIHPKDRDDFLERQRESTEGKGSQSIYSFRVINKADKELWVEVNSVFIYWGGKSAALNFFRDITERKRLEAQLLEIQKMEALGTLAGGIAHDFNNLLMGILGNVSLALSEVDGTQPYYSELRNVEQLVQSGANLTRQLLGFARRGKYEVTVTDLNQVIKKSSEMFGRTLKEITIHEKYDPNLRTVEVDRGQIEQVLVNLYVNAWQAMPGGGDIYLQTENLTFDEKEAGPYGLKPGKYVKISITDNGIGMDETTKKRIFEPFFTTKEMVRGAGLGLASAYGIIANHGGSIRVYSEEGEGTTFNIYLPASEKEIAEEKKLPENYIKGTGTVLLVDDEKMIIEVAERLLKKLGYNVLTAQSGKEAAAIYEKHKDEIDLVVLDMIMPGLGGGETYDILKTIDPGVKVLLSSGYSLNGQASAILERGCDGFIQKPFRLKDLSQKVRSVLEK